MAAINIVLNAVDKYSGTLTGLNQGLELVGKGLKALSSAADIAFDAVSKGIDLARIGGAFQEQRNQFENLANSYGLIGQDIIDTVKETSANTISEFDSIAIATKGVAAGLQGQELNDALSYVKRWSEATGESFQGAAERIFTSLSSGRYSVLRQMGLVIENGAKLEDVTKAISAGLSRFGDTGFTAADKLDALNASTDDFNRKIGQGINDSKQFQSVLGGISDAVVKLVKDFDPAPVSAFVDLIVGGAKAAAEAFFTTFPEIANIINLVLSDSGAAVKSFSTFAIEQIFGITKSIASGINTVIDLVAGLNIGNVFSKAFQSIILIAGGGFKFLTSGITQVIDVALGGIDNLFLGIAEIVDKFPSLFAELGLDGNQVRDFADSIDTIRENVVGAADGIADFVFDSSKSAALLANDFNKSAKSLKINLESIDEAQQKALDSLSRKAEPIKLTVDPKIGNLDDVKNRLAKEIEGIDKQIESKISVDVKATLDADKKKEATAGLAEQEIFAALVKIIKDALVGAALNEDVPLAVTA